MIQPVPHSRCSVSDSCPDFIEVVADIVYAIWVITPLHGEAED
jgi:hypothetical protein